MRKKELKRFEERMNKTADYLEAKTLSKKWALLNPEQKKNVREIVEILGWEIRVAIQQVYIFDDSLEKEFRLWGSPEACLRAVGKKR